MLLSNKQIEQVFEAADFIESGDPLKDVMNNKDLEKLVLAVRSHLIGEGRIA